jgi:energy-coupling factor transport system permease protein
VLQSKAFTGSSERTYLHESVLKALDWAVIVFLSTWFLVAAVLYFTIGFGRFGWLLYF